MKKHKFSLNRLLKNNKIVFIVAVVVSLCIWVYMSMGSSNDTTVTITNIPIQIELSEEAVTNGLQVFTGGDRTASVSITGNRAILGSVKSSDITVTANAGEIERSGEYQLSVTAAKTNLSSNFEIQSSVNPAFVDVFVDYLRESSFQIQENVVYKVADGYYASTTLSSDAVLISGPQSKISQISKVSATASLGATVNDSVETSCDIVLYDDNGKEISKDMLTMDIKSVNAKISVLPEKEVKVNPAFINKPSGINIDDLVEINPPSIMLAASKDVLDKTDSVNLESIDFTTLLNEKRTFKVGIDIPSDCKNISNTTSAELTIDLSKFRSKTFAVDNFKVDGLAGEYKAKVTQMNLQVTVIGDSDELSKLDEKNITAVIDTSDFKGALGSVQLPVNIQINGTTACWAYGSYKANVTISKS